MKVWVIRDGEGITHGEIKGYEAETEEDAIIQWAKNSFVANLEEKKKQRVWKYQDEGMQKKNM